MKLRNIAFLALLIPCMAAAQMPQFQQNQEVSEYSTSFKIVMDYILIPSSNNGARASLTILDGEENILGVAQSIMLANDKVDYLIPIPVSQYKGKELQINIRNAQGHEKTITGLRQSNSKEVVYDEPYRQKYHFSPYFGWTNDPNGMVYANGEFHLAYQYNPYGTKHSNMHWGNAVSKDLVHWEDLPLIIEPDELGAIFSGSAVVDEDNTSGFGKGAIVAMYTSAGRMQQQSIAYSTDGGKTYTKYEGNPVISEPGKRDFRDPKILRYKDGWVVAIAAGDVVSFYGSKNLKEWFKLSDFGKGIGSHASVWECPDLMKMEYNGKEKWALIVNINPGGPNGGSCGQYFIGDFDGKEFHADPLPYPLWIDEGTDNYAGVTFSGTGDRHVFLGWMSNWLYSNFVPSVNFRNSMTIPRDLTIKKNASHLFLASTPVPEMLAARAEKKVLSSTFSSSRDVPVILEGNDGAYEICFNVRPGGDRKISLVLYNSKNEEMVFDFDFQNLTLNLDRSRSGITDFNQQFGKTDILTYLVKKKSYEVRLFVDRHSTELFINDGDTAFTNTMFPTEIYNSMAIMTEGSKISDLTVYRIK